MKYDLEERCAEFGENIIKFCRSVGVGEITRPLVSQLIRAGTSVGANYMEANQACSKKDFINKIRICQKEANETKHWFRMFSVATPDQINECRRYWKEAHELTLIFAKISRSCKE